MKSTLIRSLLAAVLLSSSAFADAQASADWQAAQPLLRNAIECRKPLQHTAAVRSVFHATSDSLNGDHTFPEPLMVFGTLKVSGMSIYEDEDGQGYTVRFPGMKLADVAKAAKLRKERESTRYIRIVKGGHLEANAMTMSGKYIQLSCVFGDEDNDY